MSLIKLAESFGMKTERRAIPLEELETFKEVGACGTAAVISPIKRIFDNVTNKEYLFGNEPGPVSTKLYQKLQNIQNGDEPDPFGWVTIVD
jgi:branched-chain amino acid aminotransferase